MLRRSAVEEPERAGRPETPPAKQDTRTDGLSHPALPASAARKPPRYLALLRARPDGYRAPPRPSASDVVLIIEVSDTSLRYDREVKPGLYAGCGFAEVWIVDLVARSVEIHRRLEKGAYAKVVTRGHGATLQPFSLPVVRRPVGEMV